MNESLNKSLRENENKKVFKDILVEISKSRDIRKSFEDFVLCSAYAISNSCNYNNDIEQEYLNIAKKYSKNELSDFAQMLAYLQLECVKDNPIDILGNVYEEIGMSNKAKGQFFTPESVCDLITSLTLSDKNFNENIEKKGYFSMNDPACGSGRFLFSAIDYLKNKNVPLNKVLVEGDDISLLCCCMTYINLSLRGINGYVKHQNTLSQEQWQVFYTPAFVMNIELQDCIKRNNKEYEVEV